jgi:SAM-dependent methyltransferase
MVERLATADRFHSAGDYLIYCIHVATYEFARPYVTGKRVLDFGCGIGYGTHLLAPDTAAIVGVDISADAIDTAVQREAANLTFRRIPRVEEAPLPFEDSSFDVVLSFQVIEHIVDPSVCLREVTRVLKPGGVFIAATPDRRTRLFGKQRPWNEYHVVEYDAASFRSILTPHFSDVQINGMTAPDNLFEQEYRRCNRLRVATMPFTFPGSPEPWRRFGLRTLRRLQKQESAPASAESAYPFDPSHIRIVPDATEPGPDLVAVGRARG